MRYIIQVFKYLSIGNIKKARVPVITTYEVGTNDLELITVYI